MVNVTMYIAAPWILWDMDHGQITYNHPIIGFIYPDIFVHLPWKKTYIYIYMDITLRLNKHRPCSICLRFSQEGALLRARSLRGRPAEDRTYGAVWSGRAGGAGAHPWRVGRIPFREQRFIHWWTYKKLWKITIFNGKIHYFYGHFQLLC